MAKKGFATVFFFISIENIIVCLRRKDFFGFFNKKAFAKKAKAFSN